MQTYSVSHVLYPNRSSKKKYRAMNIDNLRKNLISGYLKKHPDYTLYIAKVEKDGSENYLGNLVYVFNGNYQWRQDPEKGYPSDPFVDPKTGKLTYSKRK